MNLPSIRPYKRYSSDNYGAHCLNVTFGNVDLYFSYQTLVAFRSVTGRLVVHENIWGPTTGKHLNAISSDKSRRVNAEEFARLWDEESKHRVVSALEGASV